MRGACVSNDAGESTDQKMIVFQLAVCICPAILDTQEIHYKGTRNWHNRLAPWVAPVRKIGDSMGYQPTTMVVFLVWANEIQESPFTVDHHDHDWLIAMTWLHHTQPIWPSTGNSPRISSCHWARDQLIFHPGLDHGAANPCLGEHRRRAKWMTRWDIAISIAYLWLYM